jgi:hypothetical protein
VRGQCLKVCINYLLPILVISRWSDVTQTA